MYSESGMKIRAPWTCVRGVSRVGRKPVLGQKMHSWAGSIRREEATLASIAA